MEVKYQNLNYIDTDITNVFHFLELHGSHNFLIGSNNIRNILYANDCDLNQSLGIKDTLPVLRKLYEEFLQMFEKAYLDPDYYIMDFKCGRNKEEPIRWSYQDMKKGHQKIDNRTISFEECLLMDDNVIKLDIGYINNGIFTDINCLYNFYIVSNKNDLKKEKALSLKESVKTLKEEIVDLENEKEFFKALKRYFSLSMLEGKLDKNILGVLNSDMGLFYKFISSLKLVVEMIDQDFKPVSIELVKSNLEYIKQFGSHITTIKVESYLDQLIKIIKIKSTKSIKVKLEKLIDSCSTKLNSEINAMTL